MESALLPISWVIIAKKYFTNFSVKNTTYIMTLVDFPWDVTRKWDFPWVQRTFSESSKFCRSRFDRQKVTAGFRSEQTMRRIPCDPIISTGWPSSCSFAFTIARQFRRLVCWILKPVGQSVIMSGAVLNILYRNRKLEISKALTKAELRELAYSQALNQNKIDRQRVNIQIVRQAGR